MNQAEENKDESISENSGRRLPGVPKWADSRTALVILTLYVIIFLGAGMFENEFKNSRAWIPHAALAPGFLIAHYAWSVFTYFSLEDSFLTIFRGLGNFKAWWRSEEKKASAVFKLVFLLYFWLLFTWMLYIKGGSLLFNEILLAVSP